MPITPRVQKMTFLGRPAEVTSYDGGPDDLGQRASVYRWLDDGTTDIKVCKGDGRTPNFLVYAHETDTDEQTIDALLAKWLGITRSNPQASSGPERRSRRSRFLRPGRRAI